MCGYNDAAITTANPANITLKTNAAISPSPSPIQFVLDTGRPFSRCSLKNKQYDGNYCHYQSKITHRIDLTTQINGMRHWVKVSYSSK